MINRKFKTFETISKYMKLYEVAEQGEDDVDNSSQEEQVEQPEDATNPPTTEEGDDPTKQANPETGIFMSDNQKAELAKMLIDALMMTPPEPGTIPPNLINVTVDNADEVIKYVQSLNALSTPLSLDNDADADTMAGALKNV